jgi:NAD(P)-dependent dehydrogenase (short-subunit alcohol dehydrogenase family)
VTSPGANPLESKVIVVTGGSRGLGRQMVEAFADAGASVVVSSRKLDACASLAEETERRTGRAMHAVACHVGRWEDCDQLVNASYERFGRVDALVNNAGMSPLYPSLDAVSEELFDKVVGVNLKGPFRLAAAFGTRMVADGGGAIVNISSIAAVRPSPAELPYAAAKAGLNALTLGLAKAFAPTVRVNAIMPGMFGTDIADAWDPDEVAQRERDEIPLQRIGRPEEIVGSALHLISDASSYTTGAVLTVDGGITL